MRYLTRYALTWNKPEPSQEQVTARLAALMDEPEDEARRMLLEHESAKWYECDDHLTILSREWPATLFSLDCESEDGEKYVTFFRNGRSQTKQYLAPVFNEAEFRLKAQPETGLPRRRPELEPMTLYVDHARTPYGRMRMSHLMANTPEELERARSAKHNAGLPDEHLDVGEAKREQAIRRLGARQVSSRCLVRLRQERRRNNSP